MSRNLFKKILNLYPILDKNSIFKSGKKGYWSNLSKEENNRFNKMIKNSGAKKAVQSLIPQFEDMIYSEKREGSLELLDHTQKGVCIDFGCMWGVLSIGMAKRGHSVIAIDQTYESLFFLKKRIEEDKLNNIFMIQDDIKETKFNDIANYAIVNGVLEWVPIIEEVEVKKFYRKNYKSYIKNLEKPDKIQKKFLKTIYKSLKTDGKMLLSIENRHSYQYYMGKKDPHSNLLFTTFLPRFLSNFISNIFHNKPYKNYIYSFKDMENMVIGAGFKECKTFMCYPDYHFPEMILRYSDQGILNYGKYPNKNRITIKQKISYYVEYVLMKYLKAKFFSPAIIIIAKK